MSNVTDKMKKGVKYGAIAGGLYAAAAAGLSGMVIGAGAGLAAGLLGGPFAEITVPFGMIVGALVGGGTAALAGGLHGALIGAAVGGAAGGVYGIVDDKAKSNRESSAAAVELQARSQAIAQGRGIAKAPEVDTTVDVSTDTKWQAAEMARRANLQAQQGAVKG